MQLRLPQQIVRPCWQAGPLRITFARIMLVPIAGRSCTGALRRRAPGCPAPQCGSPRPASCHAATAGSSSFLEWATKTLRPKAGGSLRRDVRRARVLGHEVSTV
jgi:hypothetical protein